MACSSCAIYKKLESLAVTYSHKSFDIVASSSIKLYGSAVAVWLLWQLGVNCLYRGEIDKGEFTKRACCELTWFK